MSNWFIGFDPAAKGSLSTLVIGRRDAEGRILIEQELIGEDAEKAYALLTNDAAGTLGHAGEA